MTKILLIGGGTGGHILPLKPLADELKAQGCEVSLVVQENPLDRQIVQDSFTGYQTHFLVTDKIRRYLSLKNLIAPFRILKSIFQARTILKTLRPDILFFKGGFVCFPFLVAAKYLRASQAPMYLHESDISTGKLTQLLARHCRKVFRSFDANDPFPLFYTPPKTSDSHISFPDAPLPRLLVFGGSQGAQFINELIQHCGETLLESYTLTLVSGPGKAIALQHKNFQQYESLPAPELAHYLQKADLVVSRAGSNSLFEIIAQQKPSIIIPLPSVARNHQYLNAQFFAEKNLCVVLEQNAEAAKHLPKLIAQTLKNKELITTLKETNLKSAEARIAQIITKTT